METTIAPKNSRTFSFKIRVPANAEPGGHFGSIVFKTTLADASDQTGAVVQQEIGSLILVKIAGDIREAAEIASFETDKNIYNNQSVEFVTRIKNNGNVHVKPQGKITISNLFGRELAVVPLEERNVLPDAVRRLSNSWQTPAFAFGRYRADLTAVYGGSNEILNATTTFWVIPYRSTGIALGVITLLGAITYIYRDRLKKALKILAGKSK